MARVKDLWLDKQRKKTKRYGLGKRWLAVWQDGSKEYSKSFKTKDAAEAHLTRIDHEQRAGNYISERENVTMNDYWPIFLKQKADLSLSSKNGINSVWNAHIEPKWVTFR